MSDAAAAELPPTPVLLLLLPLLKENRIVPSTNTLPPQKYSEAARTPCVFQLNSVAPSLHTVPCATILIVPLELFTHALSCCTCACAARPDAKVDTAIAALRIAKRFMVTCSPWLWNAPFKGR